MERVLIDGHYRVILSDEEKEDIIQTVSNGGSVRSLAKKYHLAPKTINKLLDENGVNHSHGNLNGFKPYYPDGIYQPEIEKDIMEKIQNVGFSKCTREKLYNVNHLYFDDPYREDKLYLLGFLYSDGYIQSNKNVINLGLKYNDVEILEKMNSNVENELPLRFIDCSSYKFNNYQHSNMYRMSIYSYHMCRAVELLGAVQRKSLILEYPRWLKPEWYPCFIRGVFDGDGSVSLNKERTDTVVVTITSTENFCKALVDICAQYLHIKQHIYEFCGHNGITKTFTISGRQVCKKFLDWIYGDATIYLQRKYDRYIQYYNINNSDQLNELVS